MIPTSICKTCLRASTGPPTNSKILKLANVAYSCYCQPKTICTTQKTLKQETIHGRSLALGKNHQSRT
ncbi:hypothetical protein FOPG_17671 [Fusarium oxysporum f. sp. conglutinans race 2 54008]|uniref:Uncharacterized protein n=1 Tax=Fusarium oxysporum f. sp. conglutinans race 2 54008 TaxID=1089457 RepID=X0HYE9_FUSOX|nr:hypothetical protein FOPG_17671 [Fusarium oxysporum f. sp. conglutinans race 2 54008]